MHLLTSWFYSSVLRCLTVTNPPKFNSQNHLQCLKNTEIKQHQDCVLYQLLEKASGTLEDEASL